MAQAGQVPADLRAGRARVPEESTLAHGILWEGAAVARRSTRTRADSGLRARAQHRAVPAELAVARVAGLA